MTSEVEKRLEELGFKLPEPAATVANYLPFVIHGGVIIISGQIPMREGQVHYKGKVGSDLSLAEAQDAARLCGLNILTQLKIACDGNLDRVEKCLKIGGFVKLWDRLYRSIKSY